MGRENIFDALKIDQSRTVNIYVYIFCVFLVFLTACSKETFDGEPLNPEIPGSVLRDAAGLPGSISEELLATSDYNSRIEAVIAACMRSNGFDYFPDQNESNQRIDNLGFDLPPGDFAKDFGFGISNGFILGLNPQNNLNIEYFESLNREELESYRIALDGVDALVKSGSDVLEVGGCRRQALETVKPPLWYTNRDWLAVVSTELFQRLSSDPRIINFEQQWISCMAGLGYDRLTTEEEMVDSLNREFGQLFGTLIPTRRFDDGEDFVKSLDEESRKKLDSFRSKEIELAVASHECSHQNDDMVMLISKEIERELLSITPLN